MSVSDHLYLIGIALVIGAPIFSIARKRGFFLLNGEQPLVQERKRKALYLGFFLAFAFFFSFEAIVVPFARFLGFYSYFDRVWVSFGITTVAALGIALLATYCVGAEALWGKFKWRHFVIGMLSWFIAYPVMLVFGETVAALVEYVWQGSEGQQVAVEQLRNLRDVPLLFALAAVMLTTAIPLLEEVLFRGLFYNVLRTFFSRFSAIGISAAVFAAFHYSTSQGKSNFELLASLFVLACFLAFLYERQRSLWAPIALHSTFNAVTVALVAMS